MTEASTLSTREIEDGYIVGPFLHDVAVPVVTATGLGDRLTLVIGANEELDEASHDRYVTRLEESLRSWDPDAG